MWKIWKLKGNLETSYIIQNRVTESWTISEIITKYGWWKGKDKRYLVFYGRVENWDKWEIKWGAFYQVQGLSDSTRYAFYPNMLDSSGSVIWKDAAGILLTKMKAMAYLALANENMKLLRLVPSGTSWRSNGWIVEATVGVGRVI